MKYNLPKQNKGFTVVELLIALLIGVLVVGLMASVFISGLLHVRYANESERMAAEADRLVNVMEYWITSSKSIAVPNSTTLQATQSDGSIKTFTKSSNNVLLDGNELVGEGISVTVFSVLALNNSVEVSFTMTAPNTPPFSLSTSIAKRNE